MPVSCRLNLFGTEHVLQNKKCVAAIDKFGSVWYTMSRAIFKSVLDAGKIA